uniref:Metalloendopeptidase n=1 Tax=Timema genevievae TaxID=629358 RepID=A0A7R9K5V8_TIMGE|nr:unnamed protein product [Timema genevievae]
MTSYLDARYMLATLCLTFFLLPLDGRNLDEPISPGTDEGLYNPGLYQGDIVMKAGNKNAVTDPNLLWPNAAIIYKPDPDIGCPQSPQCKILMKAIDHYHEVSCVRFKEWTGENDVVDVFFNLDSGACWSPVGRSGDGEQKLSLGQRCWYLGIVIHELGHAVGFWHEMNRPDRDSYIYVYWDNIISGFSSAFATHDSHSVDTLGEKFDYRSIMMYDEYAFSKDGVSPTLQAKKNGVVIGPIWKKHRLSQSDIRRIHKLYKCNGNKPKPGFPSNVKCNFNSHTCGFKNGGSAVWNWRNVTNKDGYVYNSYKTAGGAPGYFLSTNFHPSSKDDPRGPMGCVRFWYLLQGNGEPYLKLSQAYLDKVTQLFYNPDKTYDLWENDTETGEWIHVELPLYVTRPFKDSVIPLQLIFISGFNNTSTSGTIGLDDMELLYTPCSFSTTTAHQTMSPLATSKITSPSTTKTSPTTPSTISKITMIPTMTTPKMPGQTSTQKPNSTDSVTSIKPTEIDNATKPDILVGPYKPFKPIGKPMTLFSSQFATNSSRILD